MLIALSMAASRARGRADLAMSMMARVADDVRTPRWLRMSRRSNSNVVCRFIQGGRCRCERGTRKPTSSELHPSSPHQRVAVSPYSAAAEPSQALPARTFISHVNGVAECRHCPGVTGTQMSARRRRPHWSLLNPADSTSARVASMWLPATNSINAASFVLTPVLGTVGIVNRQHKTSHRVICSRRSPQSGHDMVSRRGQGSE